MKLVSDQIILITGATDGLGKAVAKELASMGATILLHGRNPEKGQVVLREINEISDAQYSTGRKTEINKALEASLPLKNNNSNRKHRYYNADFSSLKEVEVMADKILNENSRLDILINNAGIGGGPKRSKPEFGIEGYELRFTVNYLAAFLLTMRLLPLLRKSVPSRIVNVASGAQTTIDFEDVMMKTGYSGSRAYAQSKLALVMFSFDLADQLAGSGITVNCLHPASMMDTKMVRESGALPRTSIKEGIDSVIYVATSPETQAISGVYFEHHQPSEATPQAYDKNARKKLHDLSLKLTAYLIKQ